MKKFFTESEIKKIEAALAEAEKHSDGEIVPILAKHSNNYSSSKYILAILITLISFAIVVDVSHSKLFLILSIIIPLIVGINLGRIFPVLCLPFIPHHEMQIQVNRRACECFYSYNLGNTKRGSALLIYVSEYEHIAFVKTDLRSGKILSNEQLQEICNLVIHGMKHKKQAEGLIAAIKEAGELLKKHFPNNSKKDHNELPNKVYFID